MMHLSNQEIDVGGVMALPVVTSHSIDATFGFCERKFEFAHVYQQQPDYGMVGMAAEVGTAMHEAIQSWAAIYLHPESTRDEETFERAEEAGLYAMLEWWPWITEIFATRQKRLAATQRSLKQALRLYYAVIQHDFWENYELAVLPDGQVAIELPWRIIHASQGTAKDQAGRDRVVVTQGKIDFVLRNRINGKIRVFDLKTTNKPADMLNAAYRFSGQALGYSFVLANVVGWDWRKDGIEVTYLTASFIDFLVRPIDFHASPAEVNDYMLTRYDVVDKMLVNMRRAWWPRRQHGCESFMTACPYLSVCHRRDSGFITAWFDDENTPFAERTRIYDTYWTLET